MRRLAVGVEYDGGPYCGWQVQSSAQSVQALLETALSRIADHPIETTCAGRTDAGVHARAQVAHFDTEAVRTRRTWLLGTNHYLPADISLRWVRPAPAHFHARYSARWRTYRYLILNRSARSALAAGRALLVHQPLEEALMQEAASHLLGEHDFSAFRSAQCQSHSSVRELRSVVVERRGDWVQVDVTANAFLHHMVRNIVGLLLAIGMKRAPPERARQQIQGRERSQGEATAAAHGLYLWRVDYPPEFGLPADSAIMEPHVVV